MDFVNTRPMAAGGLEVRLARFADLVRWALQFELIAAAQGRRLAAQAETAEAAGALAEALALREALRDLFSSARDAKDLASAAAAVNLVLRKGSGHLQLDWSGAAARLDFRARLDRPAELVAAIAGRIAPLLADGRLERVKPCGGSKCVLWFLDTTRNGSRHWCRMERCGARMKAASFYRRRRAAAAAATSPGAGRL